MCGDIGGTLVGSLVQTGMNLFDDGDRQARRRQADVYSRNAAEAENRARVIEGEGERKERALRRDAARGEGRTRSMLAASGVDMTSGSALDLLMDEGARGETEAAQAALATRSRAAEARYGADVATWRASSLLAPAEDDGDRFRRAMRTGLVIGKAAD